MIRLLKSLLEDAREMIAELRDYRQLLWLMTRRDLVVRYRKAFIGFGWAIFMPVMNMVVFTIVFSRVAKIQTDVPYPIFAYSGLLPWSLFTTALKGSVNSLVTNKNLVTKVYCPRELFPFATILVAVVDYLVGGTVLALLMLYYGFVPAATALYLPLILLVQLLFTAGLGLFLSVANLYFRDVKYLLEVIVSLWMFATPVVYPVRDIRGVAGILIQANPMTPIIDSYRTVLLKGEPPELPGFAYAACLSLVLFGVSWVMFHRTEHTFAENI